VALRVLDH